jgi:hypothetical protein
VKKRLEAYLERTQLSRAMGEDEFWAWFIGISAKKAPESIPGAYKAN